MNNFLKVEAINLAWNSSFEICFAFWCGYATNISKPKLLTKFAYWRKEYEKILEYLNYFAKPNEIFLRVTHNRNSYCSNTKSKYYRKKCSVFKYFSIKLNDKANTKHQIDLIFCTAFLTLISAKIGKSLFSIDHELFTCMDKIFEYAKK